MKILLIGKTGQLGGEILRNGGTHDIFAPGRDVLDVTCPSAMESLLRDHRPEVVINTAAFHNVPLCEVEWARAFQVNSVAVRNLATVCREVNALFVTFSSDYVFGGEKRTPYLEDDRPFPLQIYGMSRLAGEYAALSAAPDHAVVIRTCGLYGISGARSKGGNFVDHRIEDAKRNRTLEMSCDQVVCPTYACDLSIAVLALIQHPRLEPGIFHLVNEGECNWYEFTKAIYDTLKIESILTPVDRRGLSGTMRRPLYTVLANSKARALGVALPHWRDGLGRYLKERLGA
jgi:dTDP-4-dehydrorhamnose reductase